MQPTLALSATHPGVAYLNGHFAGELDGERPLFRPVAPQGPVYLEYRPLGGALRDMARKLVFSSGAPMAESAAAAEDLRVVAWPGGVTEVEFAPRVHLPAESFFQLAGRALSLSADGSLRCDGRDLGALPEGAELPQLHVLPEGVALCGGCAGGRYLLTTDANFQVQTGFLRAQELSFEPDGRIRAVAAAQDVVGHATLEIWRLTPDGLALISSEPAWAHGAPRWPRTAPDAARAAVEAALCGLDAEAERYLSPALRARAPLSDIREICDLCVEMKYALPDARPCVGLLRLEGENYGRVRPLYYSASPSGGPQGPYQLDALELG